MQEPMGTTPEGRLATSPPMAQRQSTNAHLLAILLDQLMHNQRITWEDKNRYRKDALYAAALAADLDYPVHFDERGYVHIWLPVHTATPTPVSFEIGVVVHNSPQLAPVQKWAVDAYFEWAIPDWYRARMRERETPQC